MLSYPSKDGVYAPRVFSKVTGRSWKYDAPEGVETGTKYLFIYLDSANTA